MIDAKIDTTELAGSIKRWSKRFGDTNEEGLARLSVEACRQFAIRLSTKGQ